MYYLCTVVISIQQFIHLLSHNYGVYYLCTVVINIQRFIHLLSHNYGVYYLCTVVISIQQFIHLLSHSYGVYYLCTVVISIQRFIHLLSHNYDYDWQPVSSLSVVHFKFKAVDKFSHYQYKARSVQCHIIKPISIIISLSDNAHQYRIVNKWHAFSLLLSNEHIALQIY